MSTEIERRIKVLEKRLLADLPCDHRLPVLINPTEDEIETMTETLDNCPRCCVPMVGPRMVVINLWRERSEGAQ